MATLAIKGHPKRGNEVIEILEMLGANRLGYKDTFVGFYYYIECDVIVSSDECPIDAIVFTLEEFEEKFPYKVGDKVVYKTYGIHSKIKTMLWNVEKEQVFYRLESNKLFVATSDELKPLKKEIMEEKEPEPKAPILSNRYDYAEGKCGYVVPDGYEFDSIKQGFQTEIILRPIKSQYPKTYEECCEVLSIAPYYNVKYHTFEHGFHELATSNKLLLLQGKLNILSKLLICRDAYWKIAGDEMGLDKPWEPNFGNCNIPYYCIFINNIGDIAKECFHGSRYTLTFPTPEMRDTFYGNFKDLIERCKELL